MAASGAGARGSGPRGSGPGGSGPGGSVPSALGGWDEHLVAKGAELTAGRLELTAALRPLAAQAYAARSREDLGVAMSYPLASSSAGPGGHRGDPGGYGAPRDRAVPGGTPRPPPRGP